MSDVPVPETPEPVESGSVAVPGAPGDALPDGSRKSGGLTDRNDTPFGTWQYRFIDWFRDLGFLQKPGVETKAAKDIAAYMNPPAR